MPFNEDGVVGAEVQSLSASGGEDGANYAAVDDEE